ncbi:MAG: UDP-3-O-(3-hydroxymyristoyl)glucosamine N-acyltransferase [Saprospiraceae bacterium]|nr:UDP-3-O-(3-hydroxymyristoyl)glucosamine N-acyltransferase [Saprospiraceae bacterium]
MKITTGEIATIVEGTVEGDPDVMIHGPSPIDEGKPGTVSFLSNPKYEQFLYSTNASAVLVHEDFSPLMKINPSLIRVKDVGLSIAKLFEHFSTRKVPSHHISDDAFIHEDAIISPNISVGMFSVISKGAEIGAGSVIHSHVFLGENVKIGKNVTLFPGVKIYNDCEIGDNCVFHSNVVIGSDGFGFSKDSSGNYEKIPHLGKVIIESDVEIGSNSTVDRGTIGDTIIRKGVKLDNLVQIAHNAEIGENTVMAAQSGVAGSSKVGKNCVIGGQVGIIGHLKIADGTMIQGQSGVTRNVRKENSKLYGTPAISYQSYLKSYAHFRTLPDIAKELATLRKEIERLKLINNPQNPEKK